MAGSLPILTGNGAIVDDLDQALIAQLRRDGRASVLHLADRLGVSRATVRLRLARLLERQEILGFTAITRRMRRSAA